IFSTDQLYDASSVFGGRAGDPLEWSSRLPDLSVYGFRADPALMGDLLGGQQVARLAMRNVASALRLAAGRVAITQGFSAVQIPLLADLFGDPLEVLTKGVDLVKEVLGSKAFSQAIDQIGWIPIVGWIIEILASVVELVLRLVERARDKREAEARKALAQIGTLPIAQWSQGADEVLARTMMMKLDAYEAQWIVSPRYPARSASDFSAKPQKVDPGDPVWAGWLVHTGSLGVGAEGSAGLGFIPGSRNLHGAMELRTRGGRDYRDLGAFYPTARLAAVQWWEMIVGGGPAMFSVDAEAARGAWADYLQAAVEFGDHVLDGWSTSPTATQLGATSHTCVYEIYGVGECRKAKKGKAVPVVGTGHRSAYLEYLFTLFDPRRHDPDKGWERDNIDWDDTVPGRALKNLRDRQHATLQSLACMTVDDSVVAGQPRFRAIGTATSKGPLWQRWYESVKAVFESGEWRKVRFEDVPEGALKQELRDRCTAAGIECSQLGKQYETTLATKPSSLGDPVPPTPPSPVEVQVGILTLQDPKTPKKRRRVGATTWALAAGVVGGLWALSHKK
ncbi:MAG: hypothetical protein KDK70_40085, partial [Myxococcales bacterium]|nr:hypothetical protein [Myxococcales bacterium]